MVTGEAIMMATGAVSAEIAGKQSGLKATMRQANWNSRPDSQVSPLNGFENDVGPLGTVAVFQAA